MSAKDQMRAALAELMGTCDVDTSSSRRRITFDDPKVCKPFLVGCCPNDILQMTRAGLGDCPKIHELALKADYEKAYEKRKDYGYEFMAFDVLEEFISEWDRKKEIAKRKLKETQEELGEESAKMMTKMNELGEQIGIKLAKAEEVGNTGQVDESMKYLEEVEELKKKKLELEQEFRNSMPPSTYQQQKLRVCEVCSANLGIHDNDRRLADHFGGKLHLGFITIREKLEELRAKVKELKQQKLERRRDEDRNRDRDRRRSSRDRYKRSSRSRSTSKTRKSKHSKSHRSKSRSRSKSKHKSHHKARSNSRDRKRHKRSRSRSHSKKHSKKHDRRKSIDSSHSPSNENKLNGGTNGK